ncbi:MAG: SEL1-like repeat protein [Pararhodobacter sp.]|nr:SEL1-like repeat protein [Pararhodobacter sp.]
MTRFSQARLVALSLTLSLALPLPGLSQERDDFLDDFLPDAPLQPLDHILTDPDPQDWGRDVFGDPGELPSLDSVTEAPQPEATPDSPLPESITAQAGTGYVLPEGWAWHEIVLTQRHVEISYPVRIGFPGDFFMIDEETLPDFVGEEGSVAFTDTDLEAMGAAVMAGESAPYGIMATVGLTHRPHLPEFERDRSFTEVSRRTLTLESGIVMTWLSGVIEEGGFGMKIEMIESQLPIDGTVYLTLVFVGYDGQREISDLAENATQSLSIAPVSAETTHDEDPAGPLMFLDGALVLTELPEGWSGFNERREAVSFSSTGGYQGFIIFETGRRAASAADLSTSFTGTPSERLGEVMGVPARLFEGRQSYDAFLHGFNLVAGPRVMALPDHCLPDGSPLAITWAGSPHWFEQGAFERFFAAARFDGLVPCPSEPGTLSVSPPATETVAPESPPQVAQPEPDTTPTKPDRTDAQPPVAPEPVAPQPPVPPVAAGDATAADLPAEILFWESVRDMDAPAAYEAYLGRWPDGQFAALAQMRLSRLSAAAPPQGPQTAPRPDDVASSAACEALTGATINDPFAAITACRSALAGHPGDPGLHYRLARSLQAGGSDAEAIDHLRQAAEGGVALAMTALALAYRQGQGVAPDDALAARWYRAGAEAGDAQAMNNLGYMYGQGLGGLRPDPAEAARWYLRAAEAGSAFAMNNIGRFYIDGRGMVQDYAQARYWLQRGAEAGHHPAMNNLGGMHAMGQGGPIDHHQALVWFRRAADEGHAPAMANLALAYSNGQGVARDPEQAAHWFEQSIRGGAGASVLSVLDGLPRPVIRALQHRLHAAGVYAGVVDGVVGPQTRNAIRALDSAGR